MNLETVNAIEQNDWPAIIETIKASGSTAPDGGKWTYQKIGAAVGLSKTTIGKLAVEDIPDPRDMPGQKLIELYVLATSNQPVEG